MSDFHIDPSGPLSYLLDKPAIPVPDNKLGKDAFLKLLVAQMKYQNPMEPTDSSQFITQSAQFTMVEQMENMASANENMLTQQIATTAAGMIGKSVQWDATLTDDPESPGVGMVQGVRLSADGPILIVDGWEVPLARVTAFGDAPPEDEFEQPELTVETIDDPPVEELTDTPPADPETTPDVVAVEDIDVGDLSDSIAEQLGETFTDPAAEPAA